MPSIDQCEGASGAGALTALPSTLEIFDKFKPVSENGKHSDSEESFHLLLDDDDTEHQSTGGDKEVHNEETEDEILNKFETVPNATSDVDPHVEESILDEEDDQSKTKIDSNKVTSPEKEFKSLYEDEVDAEPTSEPMEVNEDTSQLNGDAVEDPLGMEEDDNNIDSLIDEPEQKKEEEQEEEKEQEEEIEQEEEKEKEEEIEQEEEKEKEAEKEQEDEKEQEVEKEQEKDKEQDEEKPVENGEPMELDTCDIKVTETDAQSAEEPKTTELTDAVDPAEEPVKEIHEIMDEAESKDMPEAVVAPDEGVLDEANMEECQEEEALLESDKQDEPVSEANIKEGSESDKQEEPVSEVNDEAKIEEIKVLESDKQEEPVSEVNDEAESEEIKVTESDKQDKPVSEAKDEESSEEINAKSLEELLPGNEDSVFKVPEELPKEDQETIKEEPEVTSDKSNDKTEDESDLLDVTMVRETEEDDACAMADIMTEIQTKTSEISDEDRMDTEQETSDKEEEDFDDESAMGFDETDEESHTTNEDDSSSCSHTKRTVDDDSSSCSQTKRKNKIVEISDSSNNATSSVGEDPPIVEKVEVGEPMVVDPTAVTKVVDGKEKCEEDKVASDKIVLDKPEKTDKLSDKPAENSEIVEEGPEEVTAIVENLMEEETEKNIPENYRISSNKRVHVLSETDGTLSPKKAKIEPGAAATQPIPDQALPEKLKVLTDFAKFMQCRKMTAQLTRSDLEQFCIQKICECLMLKSTEGDLHQQIKKNEKTLEALRRDIAQLSKQCKDLDIVNKKLMCEIRNPNAAKRPLVPLKITRSVGLQVRLNPGSDPGQYRNKRPSVSGSAITTPQKQQVASPAVNRKLNVTTPTQTQTSSVGVGAQTSSAVRQVLQNSPQKSSPLTSAPTTTSSNTLLGQALQTRPKPAPPAIAPKRSPAPAATPAKKTSGSGVIVDLTDEDGQQTKTDKISNTIKLVSRGGGSTPTNKAAPAKTPSPAVKTNIIQGKQVSVAKTVPAGKQTTTLPQGIRLAQAIQTSSANGSPQMVYVVPTITNAGGQQKVAFVNFQPSIPGQTVSVLSNANSRPTTGLALKSVASGGSGGGGTVTTRPQKHPAPLPAVRVALDPKLKPLLPKPHLTIKRIDTGIILQWKMPYNLDQYESIASYQLYAYQETSAPPNTEMWRKVGDVKALALPMACTLTQFADKNKYYFAVRSVDVHKRIGAFSDPEEISL